MTFPLVETLGPKIVFMQRDTYDGNFFSVIVQVLCTSQGSQHIPRNGLCQVHLRYPLH